MVHHWRKCRGPCKTSVMNFTTGARAAITGGAGAMYSTTCAGAAIPAGAQSTHGLVRWTSPLAKVLLSLHELLQSTPPSAQMLRTLLLAQVPWSLQELVRCAFPPARVLRSRQEPVRGNPPLAPPWNRNSCSIGRRSSIFLHLVQELLLFELSEEARRRQFVFVIKPQRLPWQGKMAT